MSVRRNSTFTSKLTIWGHRYNHIKKHKTSIKEVYKLILMLLS